MNTGVPARSGIAQLFATLTGAGGAAERNAYEDATKQLAAASLARAQERKAALEAQKLQRQLDSGLRLEGAVEGLGVPMGDPESVATLMRYGGGNFEQLSGGLTGLADLFRQHAVETGDLDPTRAAQARFAVRGGTAPYEQNVRGSVLNAATGEVDQTSPLARAFITSTQAADPASELPAAFLKAFLAAPATDAEGKVLTNPLTGAPQIIPDVETFRPARTCLESSR